MADSTKVFVPRETSAVSLGADDVAKRIQDHDADVEVDRQRVGQAATPEGPAILILQVGNFGNATEFENVIAALQKIGFEQVIDVVDRDRTISNTLAVNLDFDQRLQPAHAPGTISNDLDVRIMVLNASGDVVGAQ